MNDSVISNTAYEQVLQNRVQDLNHHIQSWPASHRGMVSDGYHTFDELYAHRIQLWITLCKIMRVSMQGGSPYENTNPRFRVWRSLRHSDGQLAFGGGWFVLGMGDQAGHQKTYHLPESYWEQCAFAHTLEQAPAYDGHSSSDVLTRLKNL